MRKIITILLLLTVLTAPLFGCDNSDISDTSDPQNTAGVVLRTTPNPKTDFEYSVLENRKIRITKYIGTDTDILIPDTIDDVDVIELGENAFAESDITSIVMSTTLRRIGSWTFENCTELRYVELKPTIERIDGLTFSGCTSLKYIKIYPKMFDVSLNVFAQCGLERIEFEEGIKIIPTGMFVNCNNLKAVKLPSSVEKIESYAFGNCRNLKSIELNDGVVEIKAYAFQGSALTEITIPKTVKKVFSSSFLKCDRLRKIIFEGDAPENFVFDLFPSHPAVDPKETLYTIYYHKGAKGFDSDIWNDFSIKTVEESSEKPQQ